jgi:hypothetical protein
MIVASAMKAGFQGYCCLTFARFKLLLILLGLVDYQTLQRQYYCVCLLGMSSKSFFHRELDGSEVKESIIQRKFEKEARQTVNL